MTTYQTRKDLLDKVAELEERLQEKSSDKGIVISGCHIDMGKAFEHKLAVAEAVKEGMKALQSISEGDVYGIQLSSK